MTMNQVHPKHRYWLPRETAVAEKAINALKASGRVAVYFATTPGFGPGFYCDCWRPDGSRGMSIGTVSATESEAWLMAAIRVAEYKPGILWLTSREFGSTWKSNVLCPDGSLGMLEQRSRLEIRKLGTDFEVFHLTRSYLPGKEPNDGFQQPLEPAFSTIGQAADFVGQYISDYEGAQADDWAAAVEAQREREHEPLASAADFDHPDISDDERAVQTPATLVQAQATALDGDGDAEAVEVLVMADYHRFLGKTVLVNAVCGYVGLDSIDIGLKTPAKVKIEPTSEPRVKRWVDQWCDPVYEVQLLEPHPELSDVRSMWIHGPSRHLDGRQMEGSDILSVL